MNETDGQGLWFRTAPGAMGNLCKPTECRLSTVFVDARVGRLDGARTWSSHAISVD